MAAYFHHHVWREVIDSHLRMPQKNTDKQMDTRAESKVKDNCRTSHRNPSLVAESQIFPGHSQQARAQKQAAWRLIQLRHRHYI